MHGNTLCYILFFNSYSIEFRAMLRPTDRSDHRCVLPEGEEMNRTVGINMPQLLAIWNKFRVQGLDYHFVENPQKNTR